MQVAAAVRVVERRHRLVFVGVCSPVALAGFWAWMMFVGRGSDALEDRGIDLFWWAKMGPPAYQVAATLAMFVANLAIGMLAGCVPAMLVRYWLVRRLLGPYPGGPMCGACGYPLERAGDRTEKVTCPECGARSLIGNDGVAVMEPS